MNKEINNPVDLNKSTNKEYKINIQSQFKKQPHKTLVFDKIKPNKALLLAIPYVLLTIFLLIIPLVAILVKSLVVASDGDGGYVSVATNWEVITPTIGVKIWNSLWISVVATLFAIIISYPFAYFLSMSKSAILKTAAIALITSPIWMSMLVKLIGLKTFFDVVNDEINSTHGHIFTIIGLVYIYLPFMILPLYTALSSMPKNLRYASYDLGRGQWYTFFVVVVPYTKNALISGASIVFLSSFTSVAISSFLNNDNANTLIGEEILNQGQSGLSNAINLARASTITLVISLILIGLYVLLFVIPKLTRRIVKLKKNKGRE